MVVGWVRAHGWLVGWFLTPKEDSVLGTALGLNGPVACRQSKWCSCCPCNASEVLPERARIAPLFHGDPLNAARGQLPLGAGGRAGAAAPTAAITADKRKVGPQGTTQIYAGDRERTAKLGDTAAFFWC